LGLDIAICTTGHVFVIGTDHKIYHRTGITEDEHVGSNWNVLGDEKFTSVSCGKDGMLVAATPGKSFMYRTEITWTTPQGVAWVEDKTVAHLLDVTVAEEGEIFAVDERDHIIQTRIGQSHNDPYGTKWLEMSSSQNIVQLDAGKEKLWGINNFQEIFHFAYDSGDLATVSKLPIVWEQTPGVFKHVSSAEEGIVWAIDQESDIWIWEEGKISVEEIVRNKDNKWVEVDRIKNKMLKVEVGKDYRAFGIDSVGTIYYRSNTASTKPMGTKWVMLDDVQKTWWHMAACPNGDIWAVKFDGSLWYRTGLNDDAPYGTGWSKPSYTIDAKVVDIGCGNRGNLWGTTDKKYIFELTLTDEENPMGTGYKKWGPKKTEYHTKSIAVTSTPERAIYYVKMRTHNVQVIYYNTLGSDKFSKVEIPADLMYISSGFYQLWGTNEKHHIFRRIGLNEGS